MAAKKETSPVDELMQDPAAMVATEETKKKTDAKDQRIAELEAQLAAAQKMTAAYQSGNDAETVRMESERCAKEGIDPWTVEVSIRVPERRDCNDKSYWGCINGRPFAVPANNMYQKMKLPFAAVIVGMLEAERKVQAYADNEIQVYDPITNPHQEG